MRAMFASLSWANYRLWFAGALLSNIGAWMQRTAQDWIVLTELTDHDAIAVGVTMALQFGPLLLHRPVRRRARRPDRPGGGCSSSLRRLRPCSPSDSVPSSCPASPSSGWSSSSHSCLAWSTAFDNPARQTFVGELVPPGRCPTRSR